MPTKNHDDAGTSTSSTKADGKKSAVYVCEICRSQGLDARYSRIEYLNRHERTHTETKPFQCEHCNKRYARSDVLFRHRRKCPQLVQNAKSPGANGSANDSVASSSKSRARSGARPYPALNSDADSVQYPGKTPPSGSSNGIGFSSSVIYNIFDKSQHGSTDKSPSTSRDVTSDLFLPPEFLPSMNGNVLLPEKTSTPLELHPFYPSMPIDSHQIHAMLDDVPNFSNSPFLKSSTPRRLNQFGDTEPLLWDEENQAHSQPGTSIAPEQTLLSTEIEVCRQKCGAQKINISNPFYFDPSRMMYCYLVDKWNMPPCSKMSALAYRTYNSVLGHLGVFHMPTFRLNDAHVWVSFAMCTADSADADLRKTPMTEFGNDPEIQRELEELGADSQWVKGQKIVQREKTELIIRAMYNSQRLTKLTPDEALPLIHALLLYNSRSFLSENRTERLSGEAYLATINSVARSSGILNPGTECTAPANAPTPDWELKWRQWISHESWRRTAWLVYILDTIASLDQGAKIQVPAREIRHIPLPCSTAIWHAPTAKEWWDGMTGQEFSHYRLDAAFACMTRNPQHGAHLERGLLHKREIGPYARHILVLTVLRGIIDYGGGKPRGGYITKRWILPRIGDPLPTDIIGLHIAIISTYIMILNHWRQAWDLDAQCHTNYRGVHFINDALPPYWLCRALIDRLSPPPPAHVPEIAYCADDDVFEEDGPNRLQDLNLREMFQMSRQFVSHGEGLGVPLSTYDPVPQGPGTEQPPTGIDPSSVGTW